MGSLKVLCIKVYKRHKHESHFVLVRNGFRVYLPRKFIPSAAKHQKLFFVFSP